LGNDETTAQWQRLGKIGKIMDYATNSQKLHDDTKQHDSTFPRRTCHCAECGKTVPSILFCSITFGTPSAVRHGSYCNNGIHSVAAAQTKKHYLKNNVLEGASHMGLPHQTLHKS
jgi:hypothetical protein